MLVSARWRDIALGAVVSWAFVSWAVMVVSTVLRVIVSGSVVLGGCCEGRVYGNDLMGGVCRLSELMLLRKNN